MTQEQEFDWKLWPYMNVAVNKIPCQTNCAQYIPAGHRGWPMNETKITVEIDRQLNTAI